MEELDGRFRLYRSDSLLGSIVVGRSHSSRVLLDSSISSECSQMAKYERIAQSVWSPDEPRRRRRQPRVGVWRLLTYAFAKKVRQQPRRAAEDAKKKKKAAAAAWSVEEEEKKKKKWRRWSSWLPDPDRRWPVQGW